MSNLINKYIEFMKDNKMLSNIYPMICTSMINNIIFNILDDFVSPNHEKKSTKNYYISKNYLKKIIYFFAITLILYIFIDNFEL